MPYCPRHIPASHLPPTPHTDNYEGTSIPLKILGDKKMQRLLKGIHNRRCWLRYAAASLRYYNVSNMTAIGISEKKVMEFTDGREKEDDFPCYAIHVLVLLGFVSAM